MRSRGEKARGYDVHKKEKHYLSDERPHKNPVSEDKKHIKKSKRSDMIFMDSSH